MRNIWPARSFRLPCRPLRHPVPFSLSSSSPTITAIQSPNRRRQPAPRSRPASDVPCAARRSSPEALPRPHGCRRHQPRHGHHPGNGCRRRGAGWSGSGRRPAPCSRSLTDLLVRNDEEQQTVSFVIPGHHPSIHTRPTLPYPAASVPREGSSLCTGHRMGDRGAGWAVSESAVWCWAVHPGPECGSPRLPTNPPPSWACGRQQGQGYHQGVSQHAGSSRAAAGRSPTVS